MPNEWARTAARLSYVVSLVVRKAAKVAAAIGVATGLLFGRPTDAQAQSSPAPPANVCTPGASCPPPPSSPPPAYSPSLEADLRAKYEREARAARQSEMDAAQGEARSREWAWQERGRESSPDPVPVRYPIVEVRTLGRFGALGGKERSLAWFGGMVAARVFPVGPALGFEVGGGIDAVGLERPRFRWAHAEPAVLSCLDGHSARVCLRGAVDVAIPFEGGAATPDYFVALKPGIDTELFVGSLGDGGYAAISVIGSLAIGGAGGAAEAKRNANGLGGELSAGLTVGF